jgi:hypothetical protein
MIRTVQRCLAELRQLTNQNYDESAFQSNFEMTALNDGQDILADKILKENPYMLSTYYDLTLTGLERYYLPDSIPFNYDTVLMMEDITGGATSPAKTLNTVWHDRMEYHEDNIITDRLAWSMRDNYVEFPNLENNMTVRIWYSKKPTGLFYGTAQAGSTTTTVVFPTTATAGEVLIDNDVYIGMKVYSANQVRRITDYVGSTKVATITPAWTTTPTTGTVELISPLPDRYQQIMVAEAARIIKIANSDDDTQIGRYIEEREALMSLRIARPVVGEPEYIRKIGR